MINYFIYVALKFWMFILLHIVVYRFFTLIYVLLGLEIAKKGCFCNFFR
jgi:hypothetical protein